jgi:monoamine oxidase
MVCRRPATFSLVPISGLLFHRVKPDVIIIGAGAAGLAAAQALSDRGRSACIVEARNRLGGRILTHHDPATGSALEAGAEFVHGSPRATWDIIRQANLLALEVPFDHRQRRNGRLAHLPNIESELNKIMDRLGQIGSHDISFAEYLRKNHTGPRWAESRRFALNFIQGFDAADPERISAKSVAEERRGIADVAEQTQSRLLHGYAALIHHLHKSLNLRRIKIQLQTLVREIRWKKDKVEVYVVRGGREQTLTASRAIVTLPLGVLQIPPERPGSIRFAPDLPALRKAATQLASGPIVKSILTFDHSFWEDESVAKIAKSDRELRNASFLHAPSSPFPTWWTLRPLRLPILIGWAGGPSALALAGQSNRQLQMNAINSLATLFNLPNRRILAMLRQFSVYDWASDPFSRGAYSYVTVGGTDCRAALARPVHQTLFFAGEATDTSGQASTVAGALASGQRAARQLLRSL